MATFLDIAALGQFSKIFVFLIVLIGLVAIFTRYTLFSDKQWLAWIIALAIAFLLILSDLAVKIIAHTSPWIAVALIFVIFISMASRVFGTAAPGSGMAATLAPVFSIVIGAAFIIGILTFVRSEVAVPGDFDEDGNEIKEESYLTTNNFFFHPKFLGVIFILLVAIFTVALLAGKAM